MFKAILLALIFVIIAAPTFAADVQLTWDPSQGATGYKIYKSTDQGATWGTPIDVGPTTTYTYTNVEENALILFRASAYNAVGEAIRTWSGAWYDHRLKPIQTPANAGVN